MSAANYEDHSHTASLGETIKLVLSLLGTGSTCYFTSVMTGRS